MAQSTTAQEHHQIRLLANWTGFLDLLQALQRRWTLNTILSQQYFVQVLGSNTKCHLIVHQLSIDEVMQKYSPLLTKQNC
jgi:hypothetical protein